MKPKNYEVLMDIYMGVLNAPAIQFTTEDFGMCQITFSLLEDRITPYNLSNCIVRMVINGQQQDCTISDANNGKAEIVLLQSMFTEVGHVFAELQIYDATNQTMRLTTPTFKYTVRKSLMDDNTVQADANYSILQQMILNVSNADKVSSEALKLSKEAKAICDDLVPKANTAAQNAQTALDRAESVVTQEELAQKVTLDGNDTKFDFIKNKVMQDGLCTYIGSINDYSGLKEFPFTQEVKNFTLQMKMNFNKLTNGKELGKLVGFKVNEFSFQLVTWENYFYLVFYDKNDVRRVYKATVAVGLNKWINVVVSGDISKPTLTMNNKENPLVLSDSNAPNIKVFNKLFIGINNSADGLIKSVVLTNRILSGQESQHNFSALDNPESIKELHTTDSTGKTSILKLASDEDHVEMASGRTLREEYMGVLKTMGKEFTSADGSPVEVPNGIEARVINAEIKGQTILNLVNEFKTVQIKPKVQSFWAALELDSNRTYYLNIYAEDIATKASITEISLDGGWSSSGTPVHKLVSGWNHILLTNNHVVGKSGLGITCDATCTFSNVSITPDKSYKGGVYCSGFNSTQAIISNNGQQYSIYANEEDKANKKVISLGGVGDVKDTLEILEDGSAIWMQNVYKSFIDASLVTMQAQNETHITCTQKNDGVHIPKIAWALNDGICNRLKWLGNYLNNENCIGVNTNKNFSFTFLKSDFATLDAVKESIISNPIELCYQLDTPIVTHIPKEIVPSILTHKTNILDVGGAVKPSSFKVTVPVDRLAEIEARLQALESTTVDVVLNK